MKKIDKSGCSTRNKKKYYQIIAIMLLGFLFRPGSDLHAQTKAKDKLLDGKTFQVTFMEAGKKKAASTPDEILFRTDKLNSNFMLKENNFTASEYASSIDSTAGNKIINFSSDSQNASGDRLKWSGSVDGENIQGKAIVSDKKGNLKKEYAFTGKLKIYKKN
jgi:hypothetical protein